MSNSSQQTTSLDDLLKDITIDLSDTPSTTVVGASDYSYQYNNDMTTITLPSISSINAGGSTYTIGSGISGISTINNISIDTGSYTWKMPKEWVDCFPEWSRVEDMCKQYPGLAIAFRNFQTVYQLVKDDYDNPTPKK